MKTLVLEVNDAGLRARDESGELSDSPGCALVDGSVIVGVEARAQARLQPGRVFSDFWGDLSLEALPAGAVGAATFADLAYHHLKSVWSGLEDKFGQVILAMPGSYTREQLSLLLGIARECGIPVAGLVDVAVVSAERPAPGRQMMHLDLMSRRAVLTELGQGKRLRRTRVSSIEDAGLADVYDVWANVIADAFVRNTRFDPMHSAQSEQQLYDQLPDWVSEISHAGRAELSLQSGSGELPLVVSSETLAVAAQPLYRKITRHIAASSRPGEALTLLATDRLHAFPGLHEALADNLPQCDVVELASGAAALGALRHQDEILSSGESVAFVTSVSWHRAAQPLSPPQDERPARTDLPTHVLYRGRGWVIGSDPLHLGSHPHEREHSIVLTGDLSGISRDHCQIAQRDGAVIIEDHSRYGTFLNDRRIEGEARAHYGDVLRLGGSEQVAQLITVSKSNGA